MKMRLAVLVAILAIIVSVAPASANQRGRRDNRYVGNSHVNHRNAAYRPSDRRNNYGYSRGNSHVNRNRGRNGRDYRYSRPATRADVRGFNGAVLGAVALSNVISEVHADKRHNEQMAAMEELRNQRQQRRSEAPRASEARGYYGGSVQTPPTTVTAPDLAPERPRPAQFTVINGTPDILCVNKKTTLNPHSSDRATVSDPTSIEISSPSGGTICPTDAQYINADTIMVVCASPKGR